MELEYAIAQEADRLTSEADRLRDRTERELRPRAERGQAAQAALADSVQAEAVIARQREGVLAQRAELDAAVRAVERLEVENQRLDARTGGAAWRLPDAASGGDPLPSVRHAPRRGRACSPSAGTGATRGGSGGPSSTRTGDSWRR